MKETGYGLECVSNSGDCVEISNAQIKRFGLKINEIPQHTILYYGLTYFGIGLNYRIAYTAILNVRVFTYGSVRTNDRIFNNYVISYETRRNNYGVRQPGFRRY
jgi:hypothetical protein